MWHALGFRWKVLCHAGQALWAETGTWDRERVCSPVEDGQGDPGNSLEGQLTKLQSRQAGQEVVTKLRHER